MGGSSKLMSMRRPPPLRIGVGPIYEGGGATCPSRNESGVSPSVGQVFKIYASQPSPRGAHQGPRRPRRLSPTAASSSAGSSLESPLPAGPPWPGGSSSATPSPNATWRQPLEFGKPGTMQYRQLYAESAADCHVALASPWHDVPLYGNGGEARHGTLSFICKTPRGTCAKYTVAQAEPFCPLRMAATCDGTPARYTENCQWNLGILPQTMAPSEGHVAASEPLEVLEIGGHVAGRGEVYGVRALAAFGVVGPTGPRGRRALTWTVLAVAVDDVDGGALHGPEDVARVVPGALEEVREWLRTCERGEGADVRRCTLAFDGRPLSAAATARLIEQSHASWRSAFLPPHAAPPFSGVLPERFPTAADLERAWRRYTAGESTEAIALADVPFTSSLSLDAAWADISEDPVAWRRMDSLDRNSVCSVDDISNGWEEESLRSSILSEVEGGYGRPNWAVPPSESSEGEAMAYASSPSEAMLTPSQTLRERWAPQKMKAAMAARLLSQSYDRLREKEREREKGEREREREREREGASEESTPWSRSYKSHLHRLRKKKVLSGVSGISNPSGVSIVSELSIISESTTSSIYSDIDRKRPTSRRRQKGLNPNSDAVDFCEEQGSGNVQTLVSEPSDWIESPRSTAEISPNFKNENGCFGMSYVRDTLQYRFRSRACTVAPSPLQGSGGSLKKAAMAAGGGAGARRSTKLILWRLRDARILGFRVLRRSMFLGRSQS